MELTKNLTIEIEGNLFDLPKRTPAIAKKFGEFNYSLNSGDDVKVHYKALDVIESLLGKDSIADIFGTTNKDEISTLDSVLVVKAIDLEYMKPLASLEEDKFKNAIKPLSELSTNVSAITDLLNHA